ncbi:MAG TPA: NADP-dependent oxidoreductase [Tepidisphaeraceae bacterium]|jgi:NADPH:quinone reductase-like Zn-dependent oxidoreductase|nr:NADP-dependent oxidoreductase [Tepidisphaeraceae bacterium]
MTNIPKKMHVASLDRFGPPNVLKAHKLRVPPIGPDEVLIKVHTAGVGSWDPDIRGGWWPEGKPKFPVVLGFDGSGTVTAIGARVRNVKVRDKVYSYSWMNPKGGFYAQYVVVHAKNVAPIPRNLDLRRAGAIPATGLTALQGIDDHLQVKRGENVIIHGAAGGVGSLALQFARLRGAHILATATGRDGLALVKHLGALAAADGKKDDLTEAALRFAPEGIDAIFATAGGKPLEQCMKALKPGGRLVYPNGVEPEPKKHKGIKILTYDAIAGSDEFARLTRATEAVKLEVIIAADFSLEAAAKAHQRVEAGHVLGRVVLKLR